MSDATRTPARNAALHPCQLTPIGVNSENALAQFTLIRRNRRSSSGFSRNLRKEVSKQDKIYFWDLGVRNAAIDNLKPLTERDDVGALWENFVLAERLKWLHYRQTLASLYFWRTYTGAEIDIVEEREGGIYAYECKWSRTGHAAACPSRSWPPTQARRSRSSLGRATGRIWAHNRRCPKYRLGREPAAEMAAGVRGRVNGVL